MLKIDTIHTIDCLQGLSQLPDECIQCCVTSPPYFRMRDYGMEGQYGQENLPEDYLARMISVFMEVHRVLKKDGTLWLNIGDSYWGSGKTGTNVEYRKRHKEFGKESARRMEHGLPTTGRHSVLKPKDLIGISWRLALALRDNGWWLRQDIIWQKLNCMPESVTDRCTRAHEYIFLLSKSKKYYFDINAIKTRVKSSTVIRMRNARSANNKYSKGVPMQGGIQKLFRPREKKHGSTLDDGKKDKNLANRRSVWTINTTGLKEEHFASYPIKIPELCIKAGSRPGDIILDPFLGSGTTALSAKLLDRHFLGFELNPLYVQMANRRLRKHLGLFYL